MLNILIADDSDVMRQLLRAVLSEHKGWSICGEATDGQQAFLLAPQLKPDLIVVDLAMPELDGLRASAEILKVLPSVPIVLYTLHKTSQIELEAKKVGIKTVVSKSEEPKVLLDAIEAVLADLPAPSLLASISQSSFQAPLPEPSIDAPLALDESHAASSSAKAALTVAASSAAAGASEPTLRVAAPASGTSSELSSTEPVNSDPPADTASPSTVGEPPKAS